MAMALLRSVAIKMARAPPRLPSALEHHGRLPTSSGGLTRFSTSTGGSMPPSANVKAPQTYNKKIPCGNEWDGFMAGLKDAAPKAAYGLVFGGSVFMYFFVIPALDRLDAQMDALCDKLDDFSKEMEQRRKERGLAALDSMGSQIESRDVVGEFSKGQRMQASGIRPVRLFVSTSISNQPTVFSSHTKPAPAPKPAPETNHRTG